MTGKYVFDYTEMQFTLKSLGINQGHIKLSKGKNKVMGKKPTVNLEFYDQKKKIMNLM